MELLLQGLRAAAEPTRLRLLALCAHAELTVTELNQILGQSQPRVSRHLKLLCDAGLLERHREGTWAYYRLADTSECAHLARTLVDLVPVCDDALTRDLGRLDAIKQTRAAAAADYFRANAERWDEIRSLYVPEGEVEAALLKVIGEDPIEDFLDIGTGTGRILEVFAPHIRRGTGIDFSHEMLQIARARLEEAGHRHCQVRHGDMYNLQLPASEFDVVVLHQVLHYAEEPASVIAEAAQTLRPGGRLLLVDFAVHDQEFLRGEHQHRWLGFEHAQVDEWCAQAHLNPKQAVELAGGRLTVVIWQAEREGDTPS
ncbi:MAG: metalloregulator ArsR/SmtB family transcription factor [Alphaproteobacteria bacterium]|nr:metalloregulator ArsR/SmtB family transcription factor [Alphaproteobacteria bacterium]